LRETVTFAVAAAVTFPATGVKVVEEVPAYTGITEARIMSSGLLLETVTRPTLPVGIGWDRYTVQVVELFDCTVAGVHCKDETIGPDGGAGATGATSEIEADWEAPFQEAAMVAV
jgi:hypothetical protein